MKSNFKYTGISKKLGIYKCSYTKESNKHNYINNNEHNTFSFSKSENQGKPIVECRQ